jgi:hypothetical protein
MMTSSFVYEEGNIGGGRQAVPPALEVAAVSFILMDMGNGVMRAAAPVLMIPEEARVKAAGPGYTRIEMMEAPAVEDVTTTVLKVLGVDGHQRMQDAKISAFARPIDERTFDVVALVLGLI